MKKLQKKQLAKVNGGDKCDRLERRFWRNFGTEKGIKLIEKMMELGC